MVNNGNRKPAYSPNITARVTADTKQKLEKAADAHQKSLRQEIEARLQASFEGEDLAAVLIDNRRLITPLVVFAREYGRLLSLMEIDRNSKLAMVLAGELFQHVALSFAGGSLPDGLNELDEEHKACSKGDKDIALASKEALETIETSLDPQIQTEAYSIARSILRKTNTYLSQQALPAPNIAQAVYFAARAANDAIEEQKALERIRTKQKWVNKAFLRKSVKGEASLQDDNKSDKVYPDSYGKW